jgi:hypothetical protein
MSILTEPDRQALAAQDVRTADDLTARTLQDPQFPDRFGPAAAARIRMVVSSVVRQRSGNFLAQSRSFTEGRFRKYRFDAFVLLALLLISVALWRDRHVPAPSRAVVRPHAGLPPFHLIVSSDLRLSCNSNSPPAKEALDNLVSRYSLVYLEPCAPVDPNQLSSGPRLTSELNGRITVRLKVQPTSAFAGMPPPFRVSLMVAPHERGTSSLLLNDIYLLDLQKDTDGMSAVVAIPSADEPTLASFVARSDLFLVARQP